MDFDYRLLAKYLTGMLSPEEKETNNKITAAYLITERSI